MPVGIGHRRRAKGGRVVGDQGGGEGRAGSPSSTRVTSRLRVVSRGGRTAGPRYGRLRGGATEICFSGWARDGLNVAPGVVDDVGLDAARVHDSGHQVVRVVEEAVTVTTGVGEAG